MTAARLVGFFTDVKHGLIGQFSQKKHLLSLRVQLP
jgi:hypothetical protein